MVIHKENKNVGVLGRILTQLMFVFFRRGIPSKSWPAGQAVPLSFSQELVFHLSIHICSDGPSSLIQNFFFRELTCCIKCFQPSFPQRLELLYFSFLPPIWPVFSVVCPQPNFPQTVAITCFQHLFWALSFQSLAAENNCSVTKGGALVRDRKHRAGSSFLPALLLLRLYVGFLQAEMSCCSSLLERGKFTFTSAQWWSWLEMGEFGLPFQLWLLKVE